jgi:predicted  nucleic acid-binding Zn-ribbon protein
VSRKGKAKMKREDLKAIGLTDEAQIDAIMAAHGKDVEKFKTSVETSAQEVTTLKTQLGEANSQIEKFKGMKTQEDVDTAVGEWKTKAEQAQSEAAAAILKVKQEHALERDLKEVYKVEDLVAVKAHLKTDDLKYSEKDDTFIGLKEQVEPLKASHGKYFNDYVEPPKIVLGGNNQSIISDKVVEAARQGAKLPAATQGK